MTNKEFIKSKHNILAHYPPDVIMDLMYDWCVKENRCDKWKECFGEYDCIKKWLLLEHKQEFNNED